MPAAFEVLDVHHHVGNPFAALGGALEMEGEMSREDYQRRELDTRLEIMDGAGVQQAVVIPGHGYERPNGLADTRRVNDDIARYRDLRPERFPAALGIIEPRDGRAGLDEVSRIHTQLGLAGVSFHTRFQGVSLDSRWIQRYVERIGELGMLPVIHAMDETPEEALWKLAALARAFPDLTFLALDAFESYQSTRHCFHVADVAPNIVFDTSLSYSFDTIEEFARAHGAKRVVFGTDLYSWPVGKRISHILGQILESELDDDAKQLILAGNARRIFALDG